MHHYLNLVFLNLHIWVQQHINSGGTIFDMSGYFLQVLVFLGFVIQIVQLILVLVSGQEGNEVLSDIQPAVIVLLLEVEHQLVCSIRKDIKSTIG